MEIEWSDIAKIALTSSLSSAIITWGLNHFLVFRASLKRDAVYASLRVALVLERFSLECADALAENDTFRQSSGSAGEELTSLPRLGDYPPDADWKTISVDLVNRAMSFPGELMQADLHIMFWFKTVGDHDSMVTEACHQAGSCGLRAWRIAADLRSKYKIPSSTASTGRWDFLKSLREMDAAKMKADAANSEE